MDQGFRPEVVIGGMVVLQPVVGQRSLEVEVEASVRQEAGWGRAGAGVLQGGPEEGQGRGRSKDALEAAGIDALGRRSDGGHGKQ
jgi:hypothetical protein